MGIPTPEQGDATAATNTVKAATAWVGVAFGQANLSFSDIAAILAAVYSLLLIGDFIWKKWKRCWGCKRG